MKQIMTGPLGRIAYHDASRTGSGQYPALNLPDQNFARGDLLVAANEPYAPNVIGLPRQTRSRAALAMFGTPEKREN
ncbi:hypothetical protein K3757_11845 [Sulfitobacter sp. S223]|uniref:hypothetical protein n=1 Tax=Sulfitobacter sp. S223 TaxID=2867023 RepID=UPI0021A73D99|nr:hypothetical protein [Sulfitobacter sp. S223]UWR25162.1 hypothetical protein K3757_11845 [Sulfitobacter sp. S223]